MPETITRKTLTVTEAATFLGVSRHFAYQAVREGSIPSIRIGRRILIPIQAFEQLLANVGNAISSN